MEQPSSANAPPRRALLVGEQQGGRRATPLTALTRGLEREGVEVTAAGDGKTALHSVAERQFDLVLCDIEMPRTAGSDLLRALREREEHVPVILLCAQRQDGPSPLEAAEQGAYCFEKPVALASLLRAVMGQIRAGGGQGRAPSSPRHLEGEQVSATVAKNEFGRVLEVALRRGRVVITKHNAPKAVLLSADEYEALAGRAAPNLETLRDEFDAWLERMQTPVAETATRTLFAASSSALGRAAVTAARRSKRARGRG